VKGLVAFVAALVALLVVATWGLGGNEACPAVGWSSEIRAELTGDWSPHPERTVRIECGPACEPLTLLPEPDGPETSIPTPPPMPTDSVAIRFLTPHPDSAVVTMLGPDGTVVTEVEAELEFERVGGSAECGGPMRATVTVPAPAP
jgi:hypothetical protein